MSEPSHTQVPVLVHIATGSDDEARRIAWHLVEARLAACVQRHPVTSTYRWNEEIVEGEEVMLTVKTLAGKVRALEAAVLAMHSYDLPEILVVAVMDGHAAYLDWMARET